MLASERQNKKLYEVELERQEKIEMEWVIMHKRQEEKHNKEHEKKEREYQIRRQEIDFKNKTSRILQEQ